MIYLALLRGINVGGNSKVEMPKLKTTFERIGFKNVKTYINSGNVIFQDSKRTEQEIVSLIEQALQEDFGFSIKVIVRDYENIKAVVRAIPDNWTNDKNMKCDVMFLWDEADKPSILDQLTVNPEIEDVKYLHGTILWRIDRENVTKSGILKIVGTDLYKKMTVRNCNTTRKLAQLMADYNSHLSMLPD